MCCVHIFHFSTIQENIVQSIQVWYTMLLQTNMLEEIIHTNLLFRVLGNFIIFFFSEE